MFVHGLCFQVVRRVPPAVVGGKHARRLVGLEPLKQGAVRFGLIRLAGRPIGPRQIVMRIRVLGVDGQNRQEVFGRGVMAFLQQPDAAQFARDPPVVGKPVA